MAEGVMTQTKEAITAPVHHPWKWIVGGLVFMVFVFILEAFKPGIITGPIKSFIGMFGLKTA